ncbi:hypothetical protein TI39_contig4204g00014 [Zymoseptoria brevis]|uniref:Uncharacterized protein n=1 Tax=Zymoseptoria brevis TaxID=1047168 RepID=A0A0F4GDK7_9PEZI|nr:hypothetical protein TI39_contig4204g00014 [Zymoseptoria brevis]
MTALDSQALHPQLLAVSRFIRSETTPILYRINALELSMHELERFLQKCGSLIQYVRQLTVNIAGNMIQSEIRHIEKALLPAKRLQVLVFANDIYFSDLSKTPRTLPRRMAQVLKP